jgi:protein gp37
MGDKSKIEWTDATWNPVVGCTAVSRGCKNCWARRVFNRSYVGPFNQPRCFNLRLDWPLRLGRIDQKARRIAAALMGDLFHKDVPTDFIVKVFAIIYRAQLVNRHIFQILTKRPERMREIISSLHGTVPGMKALAWEDFWPLPNVWLGVSIEDQATADERIPLLLQTPAAVRWVSYEPALGPIDFRAYLIDKLYRCQNAYALDWVVAGGESGPKATPMKAEWARSVRDQCQVHHVPFFFKQWGEWLPAGQDGAQIPGEPQQINSSDAPIRIGKKRAGRLLDGREWNEMPEVKR